ncbi:MAG: indolepyruvate ferredoxin oxidoreductase subunit alpha [Prevotellaceae bacterium]|jgi:indolepyruvate ferredoxin oxidoreductase alpha subunit|nr:indolepyruvate ferredoxin oxidoreductase subunit alpha [Prevotellaceae bacterium]
MKNILLLGDEAIAQGAIDGGLSGCYAYPGTPSTEIMEYVQRSKTACENDIHRVWSANEKTAFESAIGMSYAGKRCMVCFKHVGLNVAADAFMNSAITGINGGLVIVSADDPSMHSSQNEQDSRVYAKFAMIPVLEPCNQQEAYDMAYTAFELSENLGLPVMIRITTRLAHSRSSVETKPQKPQNDLHLPTSAKQFILLPAIARRNYESLIKKQTVMRELSEKSQFNKYIDGSDKSLGIITTGIAYNYLMENFIDRPCNYPVLKITQYPLPRNYMEKIYDECDRIIVAEEGYPVIEELLKGFISDNSKILGRLSGALPRVGELTPAILAKALNIDADKPCEVPDFVAARPPQLCQGCSHRDVAEIINSAVNQYGKGRVFADIGCYTLMALPPFDAIDTCVEMGASITMAKGAADAGLVPSIAIIGDSTFTHSGMTGLLDAVNEKSPITVIISDNLTTGMTGGQDSSGTNRLVEICKGIGVEQEHVRVIIPLKKNFEANLDILKEEMQYGGVSVIIAQRECIQTFARRAKNRKANQQTDE